MTTYTGGCHCGLVRYQVDADISESITCNCSNCAMRGLILTFVPKSQFTLLQGEDELRAYHFNKKVIDHMICAHCGVEAFGKGKGGDGAEMVAVNVRCLDGVDVSMLSPAPFNGKDA